MYEAIKNKKKKEKNCLVSGVRDTEYIYIYIFRCIIVIMSVIGLDIGNESSIVGIARKKGIDVLLNDESKRETPSMVGFGPKQRSLGTAASAGMSSSSTSPVHLIPFKWMDTNIFVT